MRHTFVSAFAVTAALSAAAVGLAAPASAATISYTEADCSAGTLNGKTYSAAVGDSLNITFTNCAVFFMSATGVTPPNYSSTLMAGGNMYLAGVSGSGYILSVSNAVAANQVIYFAATPNPGSPSGSFTISVTAGGGGGGGGSSSSTVQAPPAHVQQFGKPAQGTCDAAQPSGLNWSGVASGGWSESWAEWVNNGRGGPVCTRTLIYRPQLSAWVSN
jgi:hypothetical protein